MSDNIVTLHKRETIDDVLSDIKEQNPSSILAIGVTEEGYLFMSSNLELTDRDAIYLMELAKMKLLQSALDD